MKVFTPFNNFARGQVDHDMNGRFDLPIYTTSGDLLSNFITNFKGNAIFRTGFESMAEFEDCVLVEFKFNKQQQYLCTFFENKVKFLSYDVDGNFGWVLDSLSAELEVVTTITLEQARTMDFTQNDDVMVIAGDDFVLSQLKRVSSNSFLFSDYVFSDAGGSPFVSKVAAITGITKANPAVVTATAHGFRDGDVVDIAAVGGMVEVNGLTFSIKILTVNTFQLVGTDSTSYTTYTSGGTSTREASNPSCCLFYGSRLYLAATSTRITTIWASAAGNYASFDLATSPTVTSPLQFTVSDISQKIEWLYGGDNSLIAGASDGIVAINGGAVGEAITAENIDATLTSAEPTSGVYPFSKGGLIFYIGTDNRTMYYFQYDILKESFFSEDANILSYDITEGGIKKLRYKKDRNDLIFAVKEDDEGSMIACNFNVKESIVGWSEHTTNGRFLDHAVITDNEGKPQLFALALRGGSYFIERQGDYVEYKKRVKFFTEPTSNTTQAKLAAERIDDIAHNRFVAEQMKACIYTDGSVLYNNLQDNLITYDDVAGTITSTDPVFSSGDVDKQIVYKTLTGYESGRFRITAYTSSTVVEVDVLQEPTSLTYQDWYLTFSTLSGLTAYEGETVAVVADGGFLSNFVVSGGEIDFNKQVSSVCIGYKYKGIIKSFSLGFQFKSVNTQVTMKSISGFDTRFVTSAGVQVGSSLYNLENVQELTPDDINYLPPIPMDGTKSTQFSDESEQDKSFYIVQDLPLPATITAVVPATNYSVTP